jgi:hypothetical protein
MSVFFNGQIIVSPATASVVNDAGLANTNLTVGNVLAIVGECTGGQPNTPLTFGDAASAAATLISGELLTAVQKAFDASNSANINAPSEIIAIRVNPALQAALVLNNASAAAVIDLVSTDYGQYTNQINVTIAAGSTTGIKATTRLGNAFYTQDNIANSPFQIQYTGGQASATMTITATTLTLDAPSGTVIQAIALASYPTIGQLVDYINSLSGFSAAVLGGNINTPTANALDFITAQDVKTAVYTATANLQAVINWFNGLGEPLVTATRATNAGTVPVAVGPVYLSGGSDGSVTNTQWANAFTTLQASDVQWVVPVSSDPSIAAMADAHVQFMSTTGRSERRAICGTALGTTDAQAIADAFAINSDRTSLLHIGYYDFNSVGVLTLYSPYLTAAAVAGAFAGAGPGTPMTGKTLNVQGFERYLADPIETDPLILGGVMPVEKTSSGFIVTKSISTWLQDTNYYRVEVSTGVAGDYTARSVRAALDPLRGNKNDPLLLSKAASKTAEALTALAVAEPNGPGVLVGDADSPPFQNIVASITGDALYVSFEASLVIPNNYILITIAAVPFSGSITA